MTTYLDNQTCNSFAWDGRIDLFEKFVQLHGVQNCEWNEYTCENASMRGHFQLLKWLRKHECPWDRATTALAASSGHLDILEWAWKHGCEIDKYASRYAAMNGHLHILQWLKETGNLVDDYLFGWSSYNGYLKVCLWCIENGLDIQGGVFCVTQRCRFDFKEIKSTKKLLEYETTKNIKVFYDRDNIKAWINAIDNVCDELCYNDLSTLIKIFI
jgi:hypothetical protein